MNKPETLSIPQFYKKFPDEESSRLFFENKRWGDTPHCGHCDSVNVSECKDHKPMPYRCKDCRKHFSVRTGTVLAESRLPLQTWLLAIYMMTTARKGIPSTQMAKELGITQKSAWFLAQRIRETWMANKGDSNMGKQVQVDETFVGGKSANRHKNKKIGRGRTSFEKTIVIGGRDENGMVRAEVIPNLKQYTLHGFIHRNVPLDSTIVTDSFAGYTDLLGYKHISVNHRVGQYVKDMAHTNGIESFWALLKRGYYGIYHHMSAKHLHRYVNEFSFRHNTANVGTMDFIAMTVEKMENRRLTYKELINVA